MQDYDNIYYKWIIPLEKERSITCENFDYSGKLPTAQAIDTIENNEPNNCEYIKNEYNINTYETSNNNQLYNEQDKNNSENKKSPWIWIGIGIGIFVLIIIIIICICCCKR